MKVRYYLKCTLKNGHVMYMGRKHVNLRTDKGDLSEIKIVAYGYETFKQVEISKKYAEMYKKYPIEKVEICQYEKEKEI